MAESNNVSGLFILICADHLIDKFEMMATNYLVLCLSEKTMRSDDAINNAIYNLTDYLITNYRDTIKNLSDLYRRFIYDPSETEDSDEGRRGEGILLGRPIESERNPKKGGCQGMLHPLALIMKKLFSKNN